MVYWLAREFRYEGANERWKDEGPYNCASLIPTLPDKDLEIMSTIPRLFVMSDLVKGAPLALTSEQANYLFLNLR